MVDDRTRIEMIGLEIKLHGQRWMDRHPGHMRFLRERGVTPEQAVRMYEAWRRQQDERFGKSRNGNGRGA